MRCVAQCEAEENRAEGKTETGRGKMSRIEIPHRDKGNRSALSAFEDRIQSKPEQYHT